MAKIKIQFEGSNEAHIVDGELVILAILEELDIERKKKVLARIRGMLDEIKNSQSSILKPKDPLSVIMNNNKFRLGRE